MKCDKEAEIKNKEEVEVKEEPKATMTLPEGYVDFPSKYFVYPGVDPLQVKLRTFRGKDEKLISSISYENFETKFIEVMSNVLTGIDPRMLTLGDRLFVMLWECINSYNRFVQMEYTCPHCFAKGKYDVDISTINVIELPQGFKEPYAIKISDGTTLQLRLLRVGDEEKANAYEKATKQPSWLYKYGLSIVDATKNDIEKMAFLEELPAFDVALIRAFHEKFEHGPKMQVTVICEKCGVQEVAPLPFRIEFLFPFGETLRRYFGDAV